MKEDDNDGIYGRWAWPEDTSDDPDTAEELASRRAMAAMTAGNVPLPPRVAADLVNVLATDEYPDVIHGPPSGFMIYRGMAVPMKWLLRALRLNDASQLESQSKTGSFTFTPRNGGSSSWSLRHESTFDFMNGSKDFNVLLIARTSDNDGSFVSGPGGLYKVGELGKHDEEQEVVGLGPIKVAKIIWNASSEYPEVDDQESK